MGPGVILPFAGGLLSYLASIAQQERSRERGAQEARNPLGTSNAPELDFGNYGFLPESMRGQAQEAVQRDPRALGWLETLKNQQGSAQKIQGLMEGSGLFGIADRLGGLATTLEGEKDTKSKQYDERIAGYDAKAESREKRLTGLSNTVNARADEMYRKAGLSQADMDAMAARYMASAGSRAVTAGSAAESDAARRGLSSAQVAALREQVAGNERTEKINSLANVADINSRLKSQTRLAANEQTGRLEPLIDQSNAIYGGITNELLGKRDAASAAINAMLPGILTSQAGVQGTAEDRVGQAIASGTLDLTGLGDILSGRSAYNTALEQGGDAAMSALYGNIGGGLFGLGGAQLQSQAMQQNQGSSIWEQILGQYATVPGQMVANPNFWF